jgi:hypothetical protein
MRGAGSFHGAVPFAQDKRKEAKFFRMEHKEEKIANKGCSGGVEGVLLENYQGEILKNPCKSG